MNGKKLFRIENRMEKFADLQSDIGVSCDSLVILADDILTIAEALKKDIATLQRQLDACKKDLINGEFQDIYDTTEDHFTSIAVKRNPMKNNLF